jgi:hypothetical protein
VSYAYTCTNWSANQSIDSLLFFQTLLVPINQPINRSIGWIKINHDNIMWWKEGYCGLSSSIFDGSQFYKETWYWFFSSKIHAKHTLDNGSFLKALKIKLTRQFINITIVVDTSIYYNTSYLYYSIIRSIILLFCAPLVVIRNLPFHPYTTSYNFPQMTKFHQQFSSILTLYGQLTSHHHVDVNVFLLLTAFKL